MGPVIRNVIRDVIRPVIGDEALVSRLLLDKFTGAAAAYSLETLSVDTSNVVCVRRSSDDTEQDFTAAGITGGALVDWVVPAEVKALYNERMYFDGVDDYVVFSNGADYSLTDNQVFEFTFKCVLINTSDVNRRVFSAGTAGNQFEIYKNPNAISSAFSLSINGISNVLGTGLLNNGVYTITFGYDGTNFYSKVDGVTVNTVAMTYSAQTLSGSAVVGNRYDFALPSLGSFYDFIFSKSGTPVWSTEGFGNTNADWEDQIGTNDGTVNGTPALFTGQGFDGFVTTLYDQSGNDRDATQATAADQPQIVASGALVTENGKPAILRNGTAIHMTMPNLAASTMTVFAAYQAGSNSAFIMGSSDNAFGTGRGSSGTYLARGTSTILDGGTHSGSMVVTSTLFNGASSYIRANGATVATGTIDTPTDATALFTLTAGKSAGQIKGSTILVYQSDKTSDLAAIEDKLADIYGITLA